jgi:hypothetical protein
MNTTAFFGRLFHSQIFRNTTVSLVTLFLYMICFVWPGASESGVVKNARLPKAKNAFRVIVPKEIMAISGDGHTDYNFKYSEYLRVMPDESLLARSISTNSPSTKQILWFDKDGRFLRNLFREGSDPGEMKACTGYFLTARNVIVMTASPPKLIWFDIAGKFEREIFLPNKAEGMTALALLEDIFYFSTDREERPTRGLGEIPGKIDFPWNIFSYTESSGTLRSLISFPIEGFSYGCSSYGEVMSCESIRSLMGVIALPFQEKYLALTNTNKYKLKIYDPINNTVVREFQRDYERVKNMPRNNERTVNGKTVTPPEEIFGIDILNIFTRGDEVWAVTSTRDETKGVLIDIFNGAGIYEDSFYIKLPEAALDALMKPGLSTLAGNSLYVAPFPKDKNDPCIIRKYLVEK